MIGVALALLSCTVVGAILTRALGLRVERAAFLGVSMLLGVAVPACVLFTCSVIGIRWSTTIVVGGTLFIAIAAALAGRRNERVVDSVIGSRRRSVVPAIIDAVTMIS